MAEVDNSTITRRNKKKGLEPISIPPNSEENSIENNSVKSMRKRTAAPSLLTSIATDTEGAEEKQTPRQRRKRSSSQGKSGDDRETPGSQTETATQRKKKKKKPKTDTGETEERPASNTTDKMQVRQDGQGSKTSLISTETPRKKGGKKKRRTKKAVGEVDEFRESPWAEDLWTMKDDIITGDGDVQAGSKGAELEKREKKAPVISFITTPVLRSQPLDKIFIETSSKFKGQRKSTVMKQRLEETAPVETVAVTRKTTIDFAVTTHRIFRVITLFLHGLTAGLAMWQLVIVFLLSSFSNDDFLEHYYRLSLPLQSSYYFLLVMCTVSACDRFDVGNPTPRFVLRALTLQNGAISIVLYLVAFILNLVVIRYDDRMYLFKEYAGLYSDNVKSDEINSFKGINTARSVLIILAWFVLSITPNSDRLGKNLKSRETGLEKEQEMQGVSSA